MDDFLALLSDARRAGAGLGHDLDLGHVAPPALGIDRAITDKGFAVLGRVLSAPVSLGAIRETIDRLLERDLPATFVFLYDPLWELSARIAARASRAFGCRYVVLEDTWAWRIPRGKSGWPEHRGIERLLARDTPELLNTWVALSDVESDRACMHFVPLPEDPSYPARLECLDVEAGAVHVAPLAAGEALAWNANVLHWGGACAPNARGDRYSCSFSLARADAAAGLGLPVAMATTPEERLDLLARQIAIYGAKQPDVSPRIFEWARATTALQALVRERKDP